MHMNDPAHYEPTFAKGNDGRLYRLEYRGFLAWTIDVQPVDRIWRCGEPMTFDEVMSWGAKQRRAGGGGLVRDLGIRLTGDLGRRHRLLGCHARVLGSGVVNERLSIWGRMRDTDVRRVIHGELGPRGGATIWVVKSHHGRHPQRLGLADGFTSREDILEHLKGVDTNLPVVEPVQLRELMRVVNDQWARLRAVRLRVWDETD